MAPVATGDVVAAGAELDERRQDAQRLGGLGRARVRLAHHGGRGHGHRQRLLGRHHELHQLAAQQRVLDDRRLPNATRWRATVSASLTQRRIMAAARTPCERRDRLT